MVRDVLTGAVVHVKANHIAYVNTTVFREGSNEHNIEIGIVHNGFEAIADILNILAIMELAI